MMDFQNLLDSIRDLTDLELATLLSLVAQQHCLITTEESLIDDLASEIALITSEKFSLTYAVISLDDAISVEKFGEAILDQNHDHDFGANAPTGHDYLQAHSRLANVDIRAHSIAPSNASPNELDSRTVANVVIAKNFNYASRDVQIAALELITRRRIYSRTTVHQVQKTFLFIPLASTSTQNVRLNEHLNDRISISHYHDPADGFANLEELEPDFLPMNNTITTTNINNNDTTSSEPDRKSLQSNSTAPTTIQHPQTTRKIDPSTISLLRNLGKTATMTPEIRRYVQDIVVFLRIARGVDSGVTPNATTHFVNLAKYLAPLHGMDFVTPSLVALAARKVYAHRLVIARPERERSMQWGSDRDAVAEFLDGLTPEGIIEEVLTTVPSPL